MSLQPYPNNHLGDVSGGTVEGGVVRGLVVMKREYQSWISQLWLYAQALGQNPTTALRPTQNLYVGMSVFDTTLGKPIWLKAAPNTWVDATGAPV